MKSKPPKEIRQRREPPQKQSNKAVKPQKSLWRVLEWFLGLSIGISGLTLTALQFQARPTASLGDPFNPNDVWTTPLIISNDGLTDLEDVKFYAYIRKLDYRRGNKHIGFEDNGAENTLLKDVDTLATGDKQEITPMQILTMKVGLPIESADFAIAISFRPAYWFRRKWRFFRFTSAKNYDGTNRLVPIAVGDTEDRFKGLANRSHVSVK